ncbi:MAG: rod shape-determining protein RodA [Muribaculaceae bacterium]|nr:rod shape-determining protein RodA [Muribaculaceae bacterium]
MERTYIESQRGFFGSIDWITIVLYLIMVVAGAVSIYAASYDFEGERMFDFNQFSGKQFVWIGLALVLATVILLLDARIYDIYAFPIFGAVLLLLLVTIFIAPDIKGSRSWISFGAVSLQPAEFGKFATSLALAKLFDSYNFSLNAKPSNYLKALLIVFLPVMLILLQHETGTALAYFSLVFVLYREGMSGLVLFGIVLLVTIFVVTLKYFEPLAIGMSGGELSVFILVTVVFTAMLLLYCKDPRTARNVGLWFLFCAGVMALLSALGVDVPGTLCCVISILVAVGYTALVMMRRTLQKFIVTIIFAVIGIGFMYSVGYVFNHVMQPHQKERIEETLGITDDIRGSGYNVNQSKIAIGSGGLSGKGFLNGTQTKLKYVPEQHTDFIFCTIGEEEGFVGAVGVLILFLLLIWRVIHIAERQPSNFGRVYGYCVASFLIFHVCINVGMVLGLCPVIGIPLPFFSYGGSSLWGFTTLLFILLAIDASRKES